MRRLVYVSSASRLPARREVSDLAAESWRLNAAAGITGMLLYAEGMFFQFLEGPTEAVEATFARISVDPRHKGLIVLLDAEADKRLCPDWSMGHRFFDPSESDGLRAFALTPDAVRRRLATQADDGVTALSQTFLQIASAAA